MGEYPDGQDVAIARGGRTGPIRRLPVRLGQTHNRMNLTVLAQRAGERGLAFLLIGGHAVIVHGHPRNTFDLDLAVPRSAVEGWRAWVLALGYTVHGEGPTFIQFNPPNLETLPLDLMIVSDETYGRLKAAAVDVPLSGVRVPTVSLRHLLALKAHSIRHGHAGRVEKDVDDVIGLVRANQLDVADPQWQELFHKYGPPELYEKLLRLQRPAGT